MKTICYFTSSSRPGVSRWLERSWRGEHNLVLYNHGIRDFRQFDAVCLVEPYECIAETDDEEKSGPYTTIFHIWKQYLSETAPAVKLLLVRFTQLPHANVVPLLDIDEHYDWGEKIAQAQPTTAAWEQEVDNVGQPVLEKLQLFFKGHNSQGIIDIVTRVRQSLNHAYNEIHNEKTSFEVVWRNEIYPMQDLLRLLRYRWFAYRPYFRATPLWGEMAPLGIDAFFDQLLHTCSGPADLKPDTAECNKSAFIQLDAYEQLDTIQTRLNFLNKKYISPEIQGQILIIDDDEEFRRRVEYAIADFKFTHAADAAQGKQLLGSRAFDLVLLDLKLREDGPEEEGLEVLGWIKQRYPDLPVCIVSTHQDAGIHRRSIRSGAEYFLGKSAFNISGWANIFHRIIIEKEQKEQDRILAGPAIVYGDQPQVLIVEDDESWIAIMSRSFPEFTFVPAATLVQTRDYLAANEGAFDLVLLDLMLKPGSEDTADGMEVLRFLRRAVPALPVVVISAKSSAALINQTIDEGARDFWPKDSFSMHLWRSRMNSYARLGQLEKKQPVANNQQADAYAE